MNSVKNKLVRQLRTIWNDDDFITGVLVNAETEENYTIISDFIENGEEIDPETILVLSIYLDEGRYEEWLNSD